MFYTSMTPEDIKKRSRRFLYAIYRNYVKRACENLGVSADKDEGDDMTEEEYPSEFKSFSQKERDKYVEEDGMSDEEFLSQFPAY